jgi:RNA polymerase sigma-70 factor, ECF subfamily
MKLRIRWNQLMPYSPTLDESFGSTSSTLLARARANDPVAWTRLVRLYSPLVYYWCREGRLQAADAADVLQDVFHAVSRSLDRFQHETEHCSFRGWLRRITVNKVRDHLRLRASRPQAEGGSAHDARLKQLPAEFVALDPEAVAAPDEAWLVLRAALEIFKPDFETSTWQAFWDVTIETRSPADVAAELGLTINAVYKAKARVLSRLRTELRPLIDFKRLNPAD